jgi:hypothetical protein
MGDAMLRCASTTLLAAWVAACAPSSWGFEGEGEGPGPCEAEPSEAWDGEAIDYEQCWDPERFDPTRCEADSCVEGDIEADLVATVRAIATERGYADRLTITDATWTPEEGDAWGVRWVIVVDWFRCTGSAGADGLMSQSVPRSEIEYQMPLAREVPDSVPPLDEVVATIDTCAPGAYYRPCQGNCGFVHAVLPGGQEGCDELSLTLLSPDGFGCGVRDVAFPDCEIPDDWACDRGSYYDPRCECLPDGSVACPLHTPPRCWSCERERFGDGTCDADCGAQDPDCPTPPPTGEGEGEGGGEGEGEGEDANGCPLTPFENLCY